jgi:hypothetical protein
MDVKRQQGGADQGDLFDEALKAALRHGAGGEGGTGPAAIEASQAPTVWDHERALTRHLMEAVSGSANLNRAYKRVKGNGGAPGLDGMTVEALRVWIAAHREGLIASLLDGSYKPQPVRGVSIPKPGQAFRSALADANETPGRWGTPTRHPHRRGPSGTASDHASSGTDPRSHLLGVELRLPAWPQRTRRTTPGPRVRGGWV